MSADLDLSQFEGMDREALIAEVKRLSEMEETWKRGAMEHSKIRGERDSLRAVVERLTRERDDAKQFSEGAVDGARAHGEDCRRALGKHAGFSVVQSIEKLVTRLAELERDRDALAVALNASRDCLVNIVGNYVMELGESYAQNNGAVAGEFSWLDVRQASAAINSARAAMQTNPEP